MSSSIRSGRTHIKAALSLTISLACLTTGFSADFDHDGVADDFTTIRDAAKESRAKGVRVVNPWRKRSASNQTPKGFGLRIRLSRAAETYLVHDPDFFSSPMWSERRAAVKVITPKDRQYRAWKKEAPGLRADAVQLGTEAGIDILLYWDGTQWRLYWPAEDP